MLATRRYRAIRKLEQRRGSRVITLIHRQESISLLGIPLRRFIDVEDSEQVLRAIRLTPDTVPIDLVAHTPGGLVLASEQIARALHRHPARVTVIVPHYAMSGGTLLALAADEIVMDENAVLGPVDPQIGQWPAASIIKVAESQAARARQRRDADPRRPRAQGAGADQGLRHERAARRLPGGPRRANWRTSSRRASGPTTTRSPIETLDRRWACRSRPTCRSRCSS